MNKSQQFMNEIGSFGYGKKQDVSFSQWKDIKKSIMDSHKESGYSKAKLKTFAGRKTSDGIDYEIGFESTDESLKSVRAKVYVHFTDKKIEVTAQTRYNQA